MGFPRTAWLKRQPCRSSRKREHLACVRMPTLSWANELAGRDRANDPDILAHQGCGTARPVVRLHSGIPRTCRGALQVLWEGQAAVDKVTGPLGPRRGIAGALKQLREDSGKLLDEVSGDLMISASKLSRLENAQGRPLPRDIRDLIRYYKIEGTPLAGRLERWVVAAQRPGWWTDFDDKVIEGLDAHLAYEADAAIERVYTLPFVPVLLQTPDYARAVFRDMERRSEKEIGQLLEVRLRRQEALRSREGLEPLTLIAVTHESTLRQVVGSPHIMREQLGELVERSAAHNVRLRVLPFTAKPAFSMTCMYAYFEYKDAGESDIVHIETHAGFFSVENAEQVRKYRASHDALMRVSLSERNSRDLICSIRDGMPRDS
jgi:transcriptional regulator with XRE-family HTH domain